MGEAKIKLRGIPQIIEGAIDNKNGTVDIKGKHYRIEDLPLDVPVAGAVYGTLLNYKGAYEALEASMNDEPYKAPPKAPILYIKPENTFTSYGSSIPLPKGVSELEMGASLGVVIGKKATQVREEEALDYVLGYTVVNDVSIPHEIVHRPAVKQKARDGFCPIGPWVVESDAIENPDGLRIRVFINGELKQENSTENLIRSVRKLIADVTDFMTLRAGDTLLVGVPENAPLARENDRVRIEIAGVGTLENEIKSENGVLGGVTL